MAGSASGAIETAAVGVQDRFDVELLFVAEMVVDGRDVGPSPLANRSNSGRVETLAGKLLTGSLDQANLDRILCFHKTRRTQFHTSPPSKTPPAAAIEAGFRSRVTRAQQLFQTIVSMHCIRFSAHRQVALQSSFCGDKQPANEVKWKAGLGCFRECDRGIAGRGGMNALEWLRAVECRADPAGLYRFWRRFVFDPRVDRGDRSGGASGRGS